MQYLNFFIQFGLTGGKSDFFYSVKILQLVLFRYKRIDDFSVLIILFNDYRI